MTAKRLNLNSIKILEGIDNIEGVYLDQNLVLHFPKIEDVFTITVGLAGTKVEGACEIGLTGGLHANWCFIAREGVFARDGVHEIWTSRDTTFLYNVFFNRDSILYKRYKNLYGMLKVLEQTPEWYGLFGRKRVTVEDNGRDYTSEEQYYICNGMGLGPRNRFSLPTY